MSITRATEEAATVAVIGRLDEAIRAADGADVLNEDARLRLKRTGLAGAVAWLAYAGGEPVGFALLRGGTLDLALLPDHRGRGLGAALVDAVVADLPAGTRVEAWSHGDHPAAARLAERHALLRTREMHLMSREAALPLPEREVPAGIEVRGATPADTDQLLRVNASAFAHHPEQGQMTRADFEARTGEDWYDPAGLLLAFDGDRLLGFHWTKREPGSEVGEVYVLGVDPAAAGRGLGTLLTVLGLRHLAERGVRRVELYVEGDNAPALAVYAGLGFEVVRTEAQYSGTPRPA